MLEIEYRTFITLDLSRRTDFIGWESSLLFRKTLNVDDYTLFNSYKFFIDCRFLQMILFRFINVNKIVFPKYW